MSINTKTLFSTNQNLMQFGNKNMEQMVKRINSSLEQTQLKFLSLENYLDIRSKSKIQYSTYATLISKAFQFNISSFQTELMAKKQENLYETMTMFSKDQGIQELISFNRDRQFLKSFTGFTRQSHTVAFLLINRSSYVTNLQEDPIQDNLKILFLNNQGRLLHIYSNLQFTSVEKLNKILCKHFTRLELLVVVDKNSYLQQAKKLLSILNQVNRKIIFIKPINKSKTPSYKSGQSQSSQINLKSFYSFNRFFGNSNLEFSIITNEDIRIENVELYVMKALQMDEIHEFILINFLNKELYFHQMLYTNQLINSIIGLYFNIITSTKHKNLLKVQLIEAKTQLQSKIAKLFLSSINKFDSLNNNKKQYNNQSDNQCYPHLFQSSKKCIVCKESKPKYGCKKCSVKFKKEIHLCINNCFKAFHLDTLKYVSIKFNFQDFESNQNSKQFKTTKIIEFFTKNEKNQTTRQSQHSNQQNNGLIHSRLIKQKLIKKRVKDIQGKYNIPTIKVNGLYVYNFMSSGDCNGYDHNNSYYAVENIWQQKLEIYKQCRIQQQSNSTESPKK